MDRIKDRPDMTLAVDRGRKALTQLSNQHISIAMQTSNVVTRTETLDLYH